MVVELALIQKVVLIGQEGLRTGIYCRRGENGSCFNRDVRQVFSHGRADAELIAELRSAARDKAVCGSGKDLLLTRAAA